jgi:hypothetical protein
VSTTTVALAVANTATEFHALGADPIARFNQRVDAELALAELERAVHRLARRLNAATPGVTLRRRSRRCAWTPSA